MKTILFCLLCVLIVGCTPAAAPTQQTTHQEIITTDSVVETKPVLEHVYFENGRILEEDLIIPIKRDVTIVFVNKGEAQNEETNEVNRGDMRLFIPDLNRDVIIAVNERYDLNIRFEEQTTLEYQIEQQVGMIIAQ